MLLFLSLSKVHDKAGTCTGVLLHRNFSSHTLEMAEASGRYEVHADSSAPRSIPRSAGPSVNPVSVNVRASGFTRSNDISKQCLVIFPHSLRVHTPRIQESLF